MCSYIVEKTALVGSAKGRKGWMRIDTANVYFDHPYYSTLDHVLAIDFTNEGEGGRDRVAVEFERRVGARFGGAHSRCTRQRRSGTWRPGARCRRVSGCRSLTQLEGCRRGGRGGGDWDETRCLSAGDHLRHRRHYLHHHASGLAADIHARLCGRL